MASTALQARLPLARLERLRRRRSRTARRRRQLRGSSLAKSAPLPALSSSGERRRSQRTSATRGMHGTANRWDGAGRLRAAWAGGLQSGACPPASQPYTILSLKPLPAFAAAAAPGGGTGVGRRRRGGLAGAVQAVPGVLHGGAAAVGARGRGDGAAALRVGVGAPWHGRRGVRACQWRQRGGSCCVCHAFLEAAGAARNAYAARTCFQGPWPLGGVL